MDALDPLQWRSAQADQADRPLPRYMAIGEALEAAIHAGRLPPGAILTEEAIARLVGTSRTPVRTALTKLLERGLLSRFDGRGFVVTGGASPQRLSLTLALLGLPDEAQGRRPPSAERIVLDFEASVVRALPFGPFRIHEQAAADHYRVSRTVVRELLSRFEDRGLMRKDTHWVVGPLTARDVAHHFAIRGRLEPLALCEAAPQVSAGTIAAMLARTEAALSEGHNLRPDQLADLERDLHDRFLNHASNPYLKRMIRQSQIGLAVNRVFAEQVGTRPFAMALREHAIVLEFLGRAAVDAAAGALEEHLRQSAARTRQRLMAISLFPRPELPEYLRPVSG